MRILLILLLIIPEFCSAQLVLGRPKSPGEIVTKYLFGENANIEAANIRFKGSPYAVAVFYNQSNRALFEKGIVFSTGYAEGIQGPNNSSEYSGVVMRPGDADLSKIARNPTLDACVLEFDFKTEFDSISFEYFFGSEEYPEYVNKGVNDVFAFLLSKREDRNYSNLAFLPDNRGPITVDNINEGRNAEFYIANPKFDSRPVLDWEGEESTGELALTYQFDGFTTVLVAAAKLEPGEWYHMKIAIADAGDEVFDSGVFIKTGSFKSYESVAMAKSNGIDMNLFKGFKKGDLKKQEGGNILLITHIQFDFDEAKIKQESYGDLQNILSVLKAKPNWNLKVSGHTDDEGELEYNKKLSERRAAAVTSFLVNNGIETSRITHFGFGESEPLVNEQTEEARQQNRRVEFEFIK